MSMTVLYDLLAAAAALLGGTLSAFLCEAFLERRETAVSPFCCLSCGRKRELWDRIPFLSWLLNGGKCRFCGAALSLREPILSLSHMALWPLALQLWLPSGVVQALLIMIGGSCLLCAAGMCWSGSKEGPGLLPVLLGTDVLAAVPGVGVSVRTGLFGALGMLGFCLLLRLLPVRLQGGELLRRDTVLYLTCAGFLMGWRSCFVLLPAAVLFAGIFTLAGRKKQKSRSTGPETQYADPHKGRPSPGFCLTCGAVTALVFGRALMDQYLGLFTRWG